ncbi:MAG: 4Fe-4S dicluster domain-containing protein [bacterium]|nr:4Fe-4S dicluster domain-containing protein [bacterium]MCP4798944.1 4Fe-4S dicluster domain-containing protein [bacterium]
MDARKKIDRRDLLKILAGTAALAPLAGCKANILGSPVGINRLRPPGAVDEEDFTGRCIRCGRCIEVCPYRSIVPLDATDGVNAGTPLILAEKMPCYLCMECVVVCPTGALQKIELEDTRMGMAIINNETCLAQTDDTLCRTCYSVCPLRDIAIHLKEFKPQVDTSACTGCGVCVHACPIEDSNGVKPILIDPDFVPQGESS